MRIPRGGLSGFPSLPACALLLWGPPHKVGAAGHPSAPAANSAKSWGSGVIILPWHSPKTSRQRHLVPDLVTPSIRSNTGSAVIYLALALKAASGAGDGHVTLCSLYPEYRRPPRSLAAVLGHVSRSSWHFRQSQGANPGVSSKWETRLGTQPIRIKRLTAWLKSGLGTSSQVF